MSRGGRDLLWTSEPTKTSNLDGIWKLNEINNHLARNEWPTIPDAIDDLNVSVGDTVLDLSWTAPSTNGLPFTLYSIEYTPNGGSSVVVTTSNTSYQLTGLLNDTEYSVRVGAVVGDRVNYSTAVTGTPTSVIFLKLAGNYTGVGTAVSPYSGNTQGSSLFRAEVSGTVYFSFYSAGNTSGDYDASFQILRNGVNVLNQSSGNGFNPAYSSSVSVSAGQTIGMYHSNNESPVIFTAYLVPQ